MGEGKDIKTGEEKGVLKKFSSQERRRLWRKSMTHRREKGKEERESLFWKIKQIIQTFHAGKPEIPTGGKKMWRSQSVVSRTGGGNLHCRPTRKASWAGSHPRKRNLRREERKRLHSGSGVFGGSGMNPGKLLVARTIVLFSEKKQGLAIH